jgi:hypothetical protein
MRSHFSSRRKVAASASHAQRTWEAHKTKTPMTLTHFDVRGPVQHSHTMTRWPTPSTSPLLAASKASNQPKSPMTLPWTSRWRLFNNAPTMTRPHSSLPLLVRACPAHTTSWALWPRYHEGSYKLEGSSPPPWKGSQRSACVGERAGAERVGARRAVGSEAVLLLRLLLLDGSSANN